MISSAGLSFCFVLTAVLLSTGSKSAAYGATAMVFLFQIFLGIGFLPIVSTRSLVQTHRSYHACYGLAMAVPCGGAFAMCTGIMVFIQPFHAVA